MFFSRCKDVYVRLVTRVPIGFEIFLSLHDTNISTGYLLLRVQLHGNGGKKFNNTHIILLLTKC